MFKNLFSPFKTAAAALIVFTLALAAFSSSYAAAPAAAEKPAAKTITSSEKSVSSAAPEASGPAAPAPGKPAAAGTSETELSAKKFAVPRNDINGLKNFAKVSDVLYRGEQPTAEGFAALKKMGVKTVISLRAFHSDRSMLAGLGLYYNRMSIYTWDFRDEYVVNFLKLVTNPKYQPVFVHCQHGADRTGTMCAIYRTAVEGWSMSDAMSEMHNFGFHTIWSNLKKYLESIDPKKVMGEVNKAAAVEAELVK
jgi:protein tyrosine phosphatase (PTP) superfamily phosphohydrolase (DUF442 family)